MSDVVQFAVNQPVEVALKFAEPKMLETQFGERAMYSLTDDRVMFLDTLTAAKIKALGVAPGDCFHIAKRKKGRVVEYDVFRDAVEPAEPRKPIRIQISDEVAQAMQAPIASGNRTKKLAPATDLTKVIDPRKFAGNGNLEQVLEKSIEHVQKSGQQPDGTFAVERKPVTQAQSSAPAWTHILITQTNHILDCYHAALKHAEQYGIAPEDVRSLLITSFIQLAGKGNGRAA